MQRSVFEYKMCVCQVSFNLLSIVESFWAATSADERHHRRWRNPEGGGPARRGPACPRKRFSTEYVWVHISCWSLLQLLIIIYIYIYIREVRIFSLSSHNSQKSLLLVECCSDCHEPCTQLSPEGHVCHFMGNNLWIVWAGWAATSLMVWFYFHTVHYSGFLEYSDQPFETTTHLKYPRMMKLGRGEKRSTMAEPWVLFSCLKYTSYKSHSSNRCDTGRAGAGSVDHEERRVLSVPPPASVCLRGNGMPSIYPRSSCGSVWGSDPRLPWLRTSGWLYCNESGREAAGALFSTTNLRQICIFTTHT